MKKKKLFLLCTLIFFLFLIAINKFQLPPYKQLKIFFYKFFPRTQIENKSIEDPIVNQYQKKREQILSKFKILPKIKILKYSPGVNIWTDRAYYNQKNDKKINNLFLLKQQRHNTKDIIINSEEDIEIVRVKCTLNNNQIYKNWNKLDYELLIIGESCIHDKVYSKKYNAGRIVIFAGGPISSDPIFISKLINNIIIDK